MINSTNASDYLIVKNEIIYREMFNFKIKKESFYSYTNNFVFVYFVITIFFRFLIFYFNILLLSCILTSDLNTYYTQFYVCKCESHF